MNNPALEQDTQRLELALRRNAAGTPQVLNYDPVNGTIVVGPARQADGGSPTQFALMNANALVQEFGGAIADAVRYAEPVDAEVVDDMPNPPACFSVGDFPGADAARTDAPSDREHAVEVQFGTLRGDAFLTQFGCEVDVASVCESALDLGDGDAARGFAYTLGNEGVARIVRGASDPLAKGTMDKAVFARKGEAAAVSADDARFVVMLDGAGVVSVIEKTASGDRVVPTVEIIPDRSGMYALGTGLLESPSLKDARALLLGCGSMGSDLAMHLAMAGVGKIILVDMDRVSSANLSRLRDSVIADVGRRKVDVLEERILGKNPSCEVVKVGEDITKDAGRMAGLLAATDVAVVSTDNRQSRVMFSKALQAAGKPCVFTRCTTRAESGDCFIARPGEACYECLYGMFGGATDEVDDWKAAKAAGRLAAYCRPEDMGDFAILPGISTDISTITAFASRLAIWELSKAIGNNQFDLFNEEFSTFNYFLLANRREKYFKNEAWSPFDKSSADKPTPQRWYGGMIPRRDDCACCGGGAGELDTGDEDATLLERLNKDAEELSEGG